MPNGTSAEFYVGKAELGQLLDRLGAETVVGEALDVESPHTTPVLESTTASSARQLLSEWIVDTVLVSEQEHSYFMLHLRKWIIVKHASPLFEGLALCYVEWVDEVKRRHLESRTHEGLEASSEEPRQATPTPDGWLLCPHCGTKFALWDRQRWDGQRHQTCGGRISLADPHPGDATPS